MQSLQSRLPGARRRWMTVAAVALAAVACYAAQAPVRAADRDDKADKPEGTRFLRFVEEGRDGGRLETAIATYKNDKGVTVHLVGAVHIADSGYYEALNKIFAGYDVLLYEMVKPKDMEVGQRGDDAGSGINLVRIIQRGMKMFLDLDYQLDGIDYTKKNFVHADLTAEEFARLQEERGESLWGMMLQQMLREMLKGDRANAAAEMDPMELLEALQSADGARKLKLILAKQFENMDDMVKQMEGPNGSVLLTERNKAAMKVLKEQIAAGRKNIGIFYGAAHLKDLEQRLLDMGFKRTAVEYRIAWDMTPKQRGRGGAAAGAGEGRGGQVDDRDKQIERLLDKLDRLEKRLQEMEEKEKKSEKAEQKKG